jgi:hypothetical protein
MNRKIAAVLLAATMLTTPAFAASVAKTPAPQTVTPDKGLKKHHVHARAWHGHKVHHAKHATPNQVKHAKKISKKSLTSASTKSHAKTAAAVAPVRN